MNGRVFIVNQDLNEVAPLANLLRAADYEVNLVTSGQRALEVIPGAEIDVLLVEVALPDINGLELCDRLLGLPRAAHVPVILLGDAGDPGVKTQAIEKGAVDFVTRPYETDEVVARVKRQVTVSRIRAALQESEAKFRSVTESAIDAIITADQNGIIRSWNHAATAVFGFTEAEMLDQPIDGIIPPRFRSAHHEGIRRVSGGGESRVIGSTVEVSALRKDGGEIPVELSLATWILDGKRYFTGILRDISERKEAEQKFRSVTESAIDAIVSADNSGAIVGWNRAAEAIFGWPAEEIVGQCLETIIPERYHAAHRAGMDRVTRTGEGRVIGTTVELAAIRRGGAEFPIELSLSTWTVDEERYYTGIIRDISERKDAEEKLKRYAQELEKQHEELRKKHEALERSREALAASFRQAQRLFSAVTDGMPGAVLNGKYRLERKIASGGFGVVYEAHQIALDRRVAVKLLRPPTHEDEATVFARFRREGISSCRVNHLNAVAVIDADISEGGFPYIVMEYLQGETLEECLKADRPLPVHRVLSIFADVSSVLAATHRAGIIHRDIKPSNIFLQRVGDAGSEERVVKVLDFGIAKLMDEPGVTTVTRSGFFVGTPTYAAPERLRHGEATESSSSDVYSVAVVLYQALVGRLPIEPGNNLMQTIHALLHSDVTPLSRVRPSLPVALSNLVALALSKDPTARPTASELEGSLRDILSTLGLGRGAADGSREIRDITEEDTVVHPGSEPTRGDTRTEAGLDLPG